MFGVLAWKKQAKTILNRKSENFSNLYILYILYTGGLKDDAKRAWVINETPQRAGFTWQLFWTCIRVRWWAGVWARACKRAWCWTHWRWLYGAGSPKTRSSFIRTRAPNLAVMSSTVGAKTTVWARAWAVEVTAGITLWRNRSSVTWRVKKSRSRFTKQGLMQSQKSLIKSRVSTIAFDGTSI